MHRPTCETCVFFEHFPDAKQECHRRPPLITPAPEDSNDVWWTGWPEVELDDWCGEHPDFPAYVEHRSNSLAREAPT